MSSPTIRVWYAVLVSFIAVVAISIGGVAYTNHVQRQSEHRWETQRRLSDQRWCKLFVQLTQRQRQTPPQTASGRDFAAALERLREEFGCPDPK